MICICVFKKPPVDTLYNNNTDREEDSGFINKTRDSEKITALHINKDLECNLAFTFTMGVQSVSYLLST